MIKKIDHIGIAVSNLEEALSFYEEALGLKVKGIEEVPEQKVKVGFLDIGETQFELLESMAPDGPVGKFIEKRGEGLHHIAILVDNIENTLHILKEKQVNLIDEVPRKGASGSKWHLYIPKALMALLSYMRNSYLNKRYIYCILMFYYISGGDYMGLLWQK